MPARTRTNAELPARYRGAAEYPRRTRPESSRRAHAPPSSRGYRSGRRRCRSNRAWLRRQELKHVPAAAPWTQTASDAQSRSSWQNSHVVPALHHTFPDAARKCEGTVRKRQQQTGSIRQAALGGKRIDAALAHEMRGEGERAEHIGEGTVAHVEAAGIGAERRHHQARAVARKTAPAHAAPARAQARHRMQVACDLARGAG